MVPDPPRNASRGKSRTGESRKGKGRRVRRCTTRGFAGEDLRAGIEGRIQCCITRASSTRRQEFDDGSRPIRRFAQGEELNEEQRGLAADLCFAIVPDPNQPPAVRAYALTICHRICEAESALGDELKLIIENSFNDSPAAFMSCARKILKAFETSTSRSETPLL